MDKAKKSRNGKPKRRVTAYGFFLRESRNQQKYQDPPHPQPTNRTPSAEFTRQCAARWRVMPVSERERFEEQAVKDKERFKSEMKEFGVSIGKSRAVKDPDAPKRPLSSFMIFCNDKRWIVRDTLKDYRVGAIAKELGRQWAALSLEDREEYICMADDNKKRYTRELAVYKERKREKF